MEKTKADRDRGQIVNKKELVGQTARFIGMIALIIAVSVVAFTLFYTRYNDRILLTHHGMCLSQTTRNMRESRLLRL